MFTEEATEVLVLISFSNLVIALVVADVRVIIGICDLVSVCVSAL